MKLSEVIDQLQKLLAAEGDLEVLTYARNNSTFLASANFKGASIAYKAILNKAILNKRERVPRFYDEICDDPKIKGEKVIKL